MRIKKKSTCQILLLMAMLFSGMSAWSQERHHRPGPPGSGPPHDERDDRGPGHGPRHHGPPPGSDLDFLSSEMRFGDKLVKGSPFSAQAVIESVQTLADGTKLTRKTTGSLYRDSEGRTRREQEMGFMGPFAPAGDAPPRLVFLSDPVGGTNYALNPENKTARKMHPFDGEPPPPREQQQQSEMQAKTETLKKQVMEGIEVEGTRSTVTIPVGQIGNNNPLEIVSERWYSPDLQIAVMTKHSDPRWGVMTYRLTNIKREEPPHSLFTVPSDYRIEENFPPRGKRRMDD
jgi:hypothetical protein